MRKTKLFFIMGCMLLLSLTLAACGGKSNSSADEKSGSKKPTGEQVLHLEESALIPSLDSSKSDDETGTNVLNQTNEGLYALNKKGVPVVAGAAEEPKVSSDKLVYTFKLRKDAKWSNGAPVTAHDYVFSWRRAVNPNTAASYAYLFEPIKNGKEITQGKKDPKELGVEAIDDTTLKVTLAKSTAYLKSLFALPTFFPLNEKFVTEKGDTYAKNSDSVLYNGPFVLKGWTGTNKKWTYVKNNKYWDKDKVKLEKIDVQVVLDPGTGLNLYNTKKLDRVRLGAEYAAQNKNNPEYTTIEDVSTFYLKFNQKRDNKKTALANKNIRKAIALAVDKKAYVDTVLQNGSVPAYNLVPPHFVSDPKTGKDYVEQSGKHLEYDTEKAKEAWKQGLKELGVSELSLEFLSDDTESAKKTSEFMKSQLESKLEGLKLSLKNVPFKLRLQKDQEQNYDIMGGGWSPDYQDPTSFLGLFKTGNNHNRMDYSNPSYDKILKDAEDTYAAEPEKRWQEMLKSEKILLDEDVAIQPLYHRSIAYLQKNFIKNLQKNSFGPNYTYKETYLTK